MNDEWIEKQAACVWETAFGTLLACGTTTQAACELADDAAEHFRKQFRRHPTINAQRSADGLEDVDG